MRATTTMKMKQTYQNSYTNTRFSDDHITEDDIEEARRRRKQRLKNKVDDEILNTQSSTSSSRNNKREQLKRQMQNIQATETILDDGDGYEYIDDPADNDDIWDD